MAKMMKLSQETIITTYISLLSWSPWSEVSLSRVAKELGVSKPALFHYFRNKQELDDATFVHVQAQLEALASTFETMDSKAAMLAASNFLLDHVNECAFHLQLIISRRLSTKTLVKDKQIPHKGTPLMFFAMVCYLSQIGSQIICAKLQKKKQVEPLIDQLLALFQHGLQMERGTVDFQRTVVKPEEIGDCRYLKALDAVLHASGMQSVSVANFAQALGVAPSTLYSSFKDKDEMLASIATEEINRMLGVVESHLDEQMEIPVLIETIIRTVYSYLSCQVDTAKFIDGLYVAFSQRTVFKAYPDMLRAYDALEALCAGSGIFMVTLPTSLSIALEDTPSGLTLEAMIDFLYHGINKEIA